MNDMVERVARAICANSCSQCDENPERCYDWRALTTEACAAIEAMREPTSEMIEAATGCYQNETLRNIGYDEFYRAMIEAALTPDQA